jgi:hypothetical protein
MKQQFKIKLPYYNFSLKFDYYKPCCSYYGSLFDMNSGVLSLNLDNVGEQRIREKSPGSPKVASPRTSKVLSARNSLSNLNETRSPVSPQLEKLSPRTPRDENLSQPRRLSGTAFKTSSPRFNDPKKVEGPPVGQYSPNTSSFQKKPPSRTSFGSSSPRFIEGKQDSPPCGSYAIPTSPVHSSRKGEPSSAAFKGSSPRFKEPKQNSPPPGNYNPIVDPFNKLRKEKEQASASFRSKTERLSHPKSSTPPPTNYSVPSTFKSSSVPSAAFNSKTPRSSGHKS